MRGAALSVTSEASTLPAHEGSRRKPSKRQPREPLLTEGLSLPDGAQVVCRLAVGATSQVFMLRQSNGARTALKVLERGFSKRNPHAPYICELRAYQRMKSKHVPRLRGTRSVESPNCQHPCLEFELASGGSLLHRFRHGPLSYSEVFDLGFQLFAALRDIHDANIVHCDIKPGNILVRERRGPLHLWLIDFGISRTLDDPNHAPHRAIMGTPAYMAPEQILHGQVTQATDIYAACVVLYAAITERRPFRGRNPDEVMLQVVEHRFTPILQLRPECPTSLARFVEAGLSTRPEDRPPTAEFALDALRAARDSSRI